MKIRDLIKTIFSISLVSFVYALPKHTITIINKTETDVQYVFVNNETDLEYKDAMGTITYTLLPGQEAVWPPAHSVQLFDEIHSNTVDLKIWERNLPLLLENINMLKLNGGCTVIIDKIDRSKVFGQVLYTLSPYCHKDIPKDPNENGTETK
ncbi:MAG: hypothetical protein VX335_00960 [Pseudomonadota bacterium]|nr:hypothetical protein [Pseudomonadota bacterium]